jgi:hypothetical protein
MSYKKKSNKERIEFCDAGNNRCHYSTKDVYDCLDENGATQCETERRRTSSTVPCTSCQQNLHGMYTDGTGKTSPSSCKRYTCTSVFEQYNVAGAGTVVTHSYPLRNEPSCAQKCNIIDGCGGYDYTTSGKFWSSCKLYGQDFNKIKRKTYGIKFWTFCSKSTQAKTTPAPAPAPSSMTSTKTLNITQAPAIRPEKEEEERLVIIVLVSVFLVVVCLPVFICVACFKNYARTNTTVVRSVQLSNQAQSVSNVVIQPVQHGQMQMQQTQQSVQGRVIGVQPVQMQQPQQPAQGRVIGVQPMQMQQMQMQQQMQPVRPMMAQAVPMQPNQQQQPGMLVVPAVPVPMYNNNNNF